jgi:organic radical activating enzyme
MIKEAIIDKQLPVIEEFYSIQGEGYHTGKPAYFIRVGGCDNTCAWCDTKFSWDNQSHWLVDIDEVVERACTFAAKSVVVTGGEPLNHNLDYLCKKLKEKNIETFLETSGSHNMSGLWDWICFSPKKQAEPKPEIYKTANELKVVIQTKDDFVWAEKNASMVNLNCKLFLQPEWSKFESIIKGVVEYVKSNPKWNISLQAHKFMQIP